MKIKVKLSDENQWPEKYRGKDVLVEIWQIAFPDGDTWMVSGYDGWRIVNEETPDCALASTGATSIEGILGKNLKSLHVEWNTQ